MWGSKGNYERSSGMVERLGRRMAGSRKEEGGVPGKKAPNSRERTRRWEGSEKNGTTGNEQHIGPANRSLLR